MARKNKFKELENTRGKPLDRIIPELVNQHGQIGAARELGMSQASISEWLKDNHYVKLITYVKDVTPQERTDIERAVASIEAHRKAQLSNRGDYHDH